MLYFDDLEIGQVFELGQISVTKEEIISFATQFDPQPFHVDEVAAKSTMYGGLIASGGHTIALFLKLLVNNMMLDAAGMGSPGLDRVRFNQPVRPGAVLRATLTVLEKEPFREGSGIVLTDNRFVDPEGKNVMTFDCKTIFGMRPGSK